MQVMRPAVDSGYPVPPSIVGAGPNGIQVPRASGMESDASSVIKLKMKAASFIGFKRSIVHSFSEMTVEKGLRPPEGVLGRLGVRRDGLFLLARIVVVVFGARVHVNRQWAPRGLGALGELLANSVIDLFVLGGQQHE